MTQEQQDYLDEVVLPKLVKMAVEDTLPLDMTELHSSYFEKETKDWNKSREWDNMVNKAIKDYVCMDFETTSRVLKEISEDPNINDGDIIDHVHEEFQIAEQFEFNFTVKQFFNQIR